MSCCFTSGRAALFVVALTAALRADPPAPAVDSAYERVVIGRADKIVKGLGLTDAAKLTRVRDLIAQQYVDLSAVHSARKAAIAAAKQAPGATKESIASATKSAQDAAQPKLDALHTAFLQKLGADLSPIQVDQVKDGLTYGVVPLTFRVYQQMLPTLTAEQTAQIHAWLVEAREHAMDADTSEEKHGWFGKYKGRINNYLAKAGFNMKEAEKNLAAAGKSK